MRYEIIFSKLSTSHFESVNLYRIWHFDILCYLKSYKFKLVSCDVLTYIKIVILTVGTIRRHLKNCQSIFLNFFVSVTSDNWHFCNCHKWQLTLIVTGQTNNLCYLRVTVTSIIRISMQRLPIFSTFNIFVCRLYYFSIAPFFLIGWLVCLCFLLIYRLKSIE